MKRLPWLALAILLAGCSSRSTEDWVAQLKAKDGADRLHAIRALGDRPADAHVAVPALKDTLGDHDPFVRRDAAIALGKLGPAAQPAAPALRGLLKDRNHGVRKAATEALKKIEARPS
jgi:HEAT repeat protein